MTQAVVSSSVRGSATAASQPKVFDIGTEAGLLNLLREIHRSALKQVVKNQLRDTLFDFKKGDNKQFLFIEKVLADAGFTVVMTTSGQTTTAPEIRTQINSLGRARVTPKFAQPVIPISNTTPTSTPVTTPQTARVSEAPALSESPVVAPAASPTPVTPREEKKELTVSDVSAPLSTAQAPLTPSQAPATPIPTPTPTPTPPDPSPLQVAPILPSVSPQGSSAMERIKQIKHAINEKVGNPVTLIDIDNQIGREYMNALLSAMKAINGGRPDDVESTMARLERAYVTALALAQEHPEIAAAPMPSPAPSFASAPVATSPVTPEPTRSPMPPSAPLDDVTPLRPMSGGVSPSSSTTQPDLPSAQPYTGLSGNAVKINVVAAPGDVAARAAQGFASALPPLTRAPLTMPPPEPEVSVPIMSKLADAQAAMRSDALAVPQAEIAVPAMAAPAPTAVPRNVATQTGEPSRLMSVAKEEQLQNLMRQNQIKEAQKNKSFESQDRATMDPLMLPEVTAGLKQLLSEWSLFKGSGFFGTGPSGSDHPLYREIAGLTMAAVIAGRFEGASPAVKQSITDYMNGWRYEEGIVHEHTETFEHYLRRVIKHILDQKGLVRPTN